MFGVKEIDIAIAGMQSGIHSRGEIEKNMSKANEQLSNTIDDLISRVSVIKMISISNELKQIICWCLSLQMSAINSNFFDNYDEKTKMFIHI